MTRLAAFVTARGRLARGIGLGIALGGGLLAAMAIHQIQGAERQSRLAIEAQRQSVRLMSATLNGNVMGALSLLGLLDEPIKREARRPLAPAAADLPDRDPAGPDLAGLDLAGIAATTAAEEVFIVGADGLARGSRDSGRHASGGLDVRFRPYFRRGMEGQENVYAAISLARGDRTLYFAAPIFAGPRRQGRPIGVIVARTGLDRVDALLGEGGGTALLLSPQGVVFAGTRPDWIGRLAGAPSPARLAAIRALRQFGPLFDGQDPQPLPVAAADGLQRLDGQPVAVATAPVSWNDPAGPWTLLLMEDLGQSLSWTGAGTGAGAGAAALWGGGAAGLLLLLLGHLTLHLLGGRCAQDASARRIEAFAQELEAGARRKSRLAEASLRFQQTTTPEELARAFLAECHRLLGALQGMVYLAEEEDGGSLRLLAGYARAARRPDPGRVR